MKAALFTLLIIVVHTTLAFQSIQRIQHPMNIRNSLMMMQDSDAATEFGSVPDSPVETPSISSVESSEDEVPIDMDSLANEAAMQAENEQLFKNIPEPTEPIIRLAPRQAGWFPMLLSPESLDGSFAGDVGFDPLGFSSDQEKLLYMREAEIKHARLAMLGVIGWPSSELWHANIAEFLNMDSILAEGGKAPSVLNGGLTNEWIYGAGAIALLIGGALEVGAMQREDKSKPGNYNFDPLGLYSFRSTFGLDTITEKISAEEKIARARFDMEYCEIRHGRAAMLGILGMVLQELASGIPVVQQTPFFFGDPIF